MATLRELLEQGKLTPMIDPTYPLDQVPAAVEELLALRPAATRVTLPKSRTA